MVERSPRWLSLECLRGCYRGHSFCWTHATVSSASKLCLDRQNSTFANTARAVPCVAQSLSECLMIAPIKNEPASSLPSLDFSSLKKYIGACLAAAGSLFASRPEKLASESLWTLRPTTFSWSEVVVLASA